MSKQLTIQQAFTVSGKGLHTGIVLTAVFLPAPAGTGLVFRRVDLENKPELPALAEYVEQTERGTVLVKDGVSVSTIEHACAALYSLGIDNCIIEVNGPEVPILDGSAIEYVRNIKEAGIRELELEKDYFTVDKAIEFSDPKSGSSIILLPYDGFRITTMIGFDSPILNNQFAQLDSLDQFENEIAACRTFVFVREIEQLVSHNLIKGGDLDNALVIYDRPIGQDNLDRIADIMGTTHKPADQLGYVNNRPLQFCNEPARHKLLDLIGDLALIGKPLKAFIVATRPGHRVNNGLARLIRQETAGQNQ